MDLTYLIGIKENGVLIFEIYMKSFPLLFSDMGRPKKVATLSVSDRSKRWRQNNPEKVKIRHEKQKLSAAIKSQVSNLLL